MSRLLVFGHYKTDPTIRSLERLCAERQMVFACLSPAEVLSAIEVWLEFEPEPKLNLSFPAQRRISLGAGDRVLNRIAHLPSDLFADFAPEDQSYAQKELEAFFAGVTRAFSQDVSHGNTVGYISGFHALPWQWEQNRHALQKLEVEVPHYEIHSHRASRAPDPNTIETTLYNHAYWRAGVSNRDAELFVRRPPGAPLVVYANHHGEMAFSSLRGGHAPATRLREATRSILTSAKVKTAELLFFSQGAELCFAAMTPVPCADYEGCANFDQISEVYLSS